MTEKKRIYVLDMRGANPEEIMTLKETLSEILDRAYQIACRELDKGNLYGCLHTHLEVALKKEALDIPCDLCEVTRIPTGEVVH